MGRSVLIVDDEISFRELLKTLLGMEGLFDEFHEAGDGEEAILFLKSDIRVDMILMDLIMPRKGGIEVINWIRENGIGADLPIMMLTVESRSDVKAMGFNLGASDYVVKPFDPVELVARIKLLLRRKEIQDELKRKNQELININRTLKRLAVTDELTQLYNRSFFFEKLSQEMRRSQRYRTPLTLVLIDLDDFKQANDTFGHLAGDEVLRAVSEIIKVSVRESDFAGRYGGEEFILCLPQTGLDGAGITAERIRSAVASQVFSFEGGTYRTSTSIGMAELTCERAENREGLIRKADLALYQAKNGGKNQVVIYGPGMEG